MSQQFWIQRADRLRRRVNGAWWLATFLPLSFVATLFACALLVAVRRAGAAATPVVVGYGIALLLAAVAALPLCLRRFLSRTGALTRLDSLAGLDNRLNSAAEGVGPWPPPRLPLATGYRWRPLRVIGPLVGSAALLVASAQVPVSAPPPAAPREAIEPLAWSDVEESLHALEQRNVLAAEPLAELREQLETLRRQPPERWYSHASLEATDTLKDQLDHALEGLGEEFGGAEEALASLRTAPAGSRQQAESVERWNAALRQLELGSLPLAEERLAELRRVDPGSVRRLPAGQFAALRQGLAGDGQTCEAARPGRSSPIPQRVAAARSRPSSATGEGRKTAAAGNQGESARAGRGTRLGAGPAAAGETAGGSASAGGSRHAPQHGGAVSTGAAGPGRAARGPGSAPLAFRRDPVDLGVLGLAPLPGAAPDQGHEFVGTGVRAPEPADTAAGAAAGGATDAQATGGDPVWRSRLPFEERELVKRYFR